MRTRPLQYRHHSPSGSFLYHIKEKRLYRYIISAARNPVTGKYKQIWRSGFSSKTEAQEALRSITTSWTPGYPYRT
ncbi:Arm DNA-binding domain-containing protein [Alicyclobacillus herbarius]|uniref:Arm DNA-binding domain-containing protein n=1 Tax=Alicyclobacillus herbarius TaxID=122960 RepID=UPI0009D7384A